MQPCLQSGAPVKVVSERLGHATTQLTLDIYAHVLPAMDAEAVQRFAALVLGEGSPVSTAPQTDSAADRDRAPDCGHANMERSRADPPA
jgi:hypothetical protein